MNWILAGHFLITKTYDLPRRQLVAVSLMHYETTNGVYRRWDFFKDGSTRRWEIDWSPSTRQLIWKLRDSEQGIRGEGQTTLIDKTSLQTSLRIVDSDGRVVSHLKSKWQKRH